MKYSIETLMNAFNNLRNGYITVTPHDYNEISEYVKLVSEKYELKLSLGAVDEFKDICNKAFDYFETKEPEQFVIFMRIITMAKVCITYKEVPRFKYMVEKYSDLVIKARSFDNAQEIIDMCIEERSRESDKPVVLSSVLEVLKFSKQLGNKGTNEYRTQDYVHSKMSEELGEHSVELQIQKGLNPKTPGKDLIHGEAVDLAICCIDSFALEFPELSAEEIFEKFNEYMLVKLNKWKSQK